MQNIVHHSHRWWSFCLLMISLINMLLISMLSMRFILSVSSVTSSLFGPCLVKQHSYKEVYSYGLINHYLLRKSPLRRPKPRPGKKELIIIEAGAAAAAARMKIRVSISVFGVHSLQSPKLFSLFYSASFFAELLITVNISGPFLWLEQIISQISVRVSDFFCKNDNYQQ